MTPHALRSSGASWKMRKSHHWCSSILTLGWPAREYARVIAGLRCTSSTTNSLIYTVGATLLCSISTSRASSDCHTSLGLSRTFAPFASPPLCSPSGGARVAFFVIPQDEIASVLTDAARDFALRWAPLITLTHEVEREVDRYC